MNSKLNGKAPQESVEVRAPRGKLIIKLRGNPVESSSRVSGLGFKRKHSYLPEGMTCFNKFRRAVDAAGSLPPYDYFRSSEAEKSLRQWYRNGNLNFMEQQLQGLKDWEHGKIKKKCSTILWADSLTKAAAEATSFARELIETQEMNEAKVQETQQRILQLEKQLEMAKDPVKSIIALEKEYAKVFENMSLRFEYIKAQIKQMEDYRVQMVQHYTRTLMHYMKHIETIQAFQNVQQLNPTTDGDDQTKKRTPSKRGVRPELRGLNLAVEAARAANPNFTLQTDHGSSSPAGPATAEINGGTGKEKNDAA